MKALDLRHPARPSSSPRHGESRRARFHDRGHLGSTGLPRRHLWAVDNGVPDPQTTGPRHFGGVLDFGDLVANTKSAEKAARQAQKHRVRNVALRSRMRTAVRSVTAAIAAKNKDAAVATYKDAVPVIDALVNKQIIHRNKAARHKSRLSAQIRAMQ
jgi:small subunit ribosomal protein S20